MRHKKVPAYRLHRSTGQARVIIDGKHFYLGKHGSPESHDAYSKLIGEWLTRQSGAPASLTVSDLCAAFLAHAETFYRKNGKITSEVHIIRLALKRLKWECDEVLAKDLSPRHSKAVQQKGIEDGLCRETINKLTTRIRRMVKWAVAEQLVPTNVLISLQALRDLQKGRSNAEERPPIRSVECGRIDAVRSHASPIVASAIALQNVTGMRPGELLTMRPCDLDCSGEIWLYVPAEHKLTHLEKSRIVCIGPKGQEILRKILPNDPEAFVFSSLKNRSKPFSVAAYRRHITRICDEKKIDRWAPNQLRHSFGTLARKVGGIEAARVSLGHSSAETSLIYAERDLEAAKQIARTIG